MKNKWAIKAIVSSNMFKAAMVLFFVIFNCCAVTANPVYDSKSYENIYEAVSAIGNTPAVLLVHGQNKINKNLHFYFYR